jgi:uncharacterized alpha-E superfamily protein
MLSRVAHSLFWLARHLERAEDSARFLAVTHSYAQELRGVSHAAAEQCWAVSELLLGGEGGSGEGADAFRRLAFDARLSNSLLSCISRARQNASSIRDAITTEMWEELNVLHLRLQEEASAPRSETAELALLQRVINTSHLFQGLRDNTMARVDEWHFLCLGQLLERGDMMARTLDAMFSHPAVREAAETGHSIDTLHLAATLRACTAFEAFSRASPSLTPARVAEFLLLDARFPRSVEFCVQQAGNSLHALSGTSHDIFSNEAEQLCGRLVAELRFASIEEIVEQGLSPYLHRVLLTLSQVGRAISQQYFR